MIMFTLPLYLLQNDGKETIWYMVPQYRPWGDEWNPGMTLGRLMATLEWPWGDEWQPWGDECQPWDAPGRPRGRHVTAPFTLGRQT